MEKLSGMMLRSQTRPTGAGKSLEQTTQAKVKGQRLERVIRMADPVHSRLTTQPVHQMGRTKPMA